MKWMEKHLFQIDIFFKQNLINKSADLFLFLNVMGNSFYVQLCFRKCNWSLFDHSKEQCKQMVH